MNDAHRKIEMLLRPAPRVSTNVLVVAALMSLVSSALLVLLAAWAMPPEYSWRAHSISESAAQGQMYGWIARLSFLCFGVAVLALAIAMRELWPRITYWCALLFAGSQLGVATFSHMPWQAGVEGDAVEDYLHSLFASGMGLAFVLGVVVRFMHRGRGEPWGRALDVFAIVVATMLPLMLASAPSVGGIVQRVMFFVGYIWFGREAVIACRGANQHAA